MIRESIDYFIVSLDWAEKLARFFNDIAQDQKAAYFHPHSFTAEDARRISEYTGKDLYCLQVQDSEILGYAMLRGWDDGYSVPSLGIVIHPRFRNRGLGQKFMKFLHIQAGKRGADRIRLKVHPANQAAKHIYEKAGYVFSGEEGGQIVGYYELKRHQVYVSSACSNEKRIGPAVRELADHGFKNIELSGGTHYYESWERDLLKLKREYDLNFLAHNYFPPPPDDFVLNLASLDDEIYQKTIAHLCESLRLSQLFGADKFGFHAGFYFDMNCEAVGKTIPPELPMARMDEARNRFCDGFNVIAKGAPDVQIYIENNVYSHSNFAQYGFQNPFMLTSADEYADLKQRIDFKILLDIAHLYVSSQSLNFHFVSHCERLLQETDYIHLSDNDGREDKNRPLIIGEGILNQIRPDSLQGKTITLEVYSGVQDLKMSINSIQSII